MSSWKVIIIINELPVEKKRGPGDFIVDGAYRYGDPGMCRLYRKKSACERMNSRAERLMGWEHAEGTG